MLECLRPEDVHDLWSAALHDGLYTPDELAMMVVRLQANCTVLFDELDKMSPGKTHIVDDVHNENLREALKAERDRAERLLREVELCAVTLAARDAEIRRLKDQYSCLQNDARLNSALTPEQRMAALDPNNGMRWSHRNTLAILTTNKGIVKLVLEVVHGVMNLAAYGDNGMIYSEPLDRVILGARKMLEKPTG